MSQLNQDASGSQDESGASSLNNVGDANSESSASDDAAKKHIEKLLTEKKNAMKGNQALKEELEQLRAEKKEREEQQMLKNNEHLKVIDLLKKELDESKTKLSTIETQKIEGKKTLAVLSELEKLGFVNNDTNRNIVMKLFDKKSVEVDPTTGVVLGADSAAKNFHEEYNSLGIFGKKSVQTNSQAPNYDGNVTTTAPLSQLTKQDLDARLKASLSNIIK